MKNWSTENLEPPATIPRRENLDTPNCIRTVSGQYVNVFDPDPETILIEDIAHGLAYMPRFGGQLPYFYSVAQHSIWVANGLPIELKLRGLLHDAHEAYLFDMPSPVKKSPELKQYRWYCVNMQCAIAEKFGIPPPPDHQTVHDTDRLALEFEWEHLMLTAHSFEAKPRAIKEKFLKMFHRLTNDQWK